MCSSDLVFVLNEEIFILAAFRRNPVGFHQGVMLRIVEGGARDQAQHDKTNREDGLPNTLVSVGLGVMHQIKISKSSGRIRSGCAGSKKKIISEKLDSVSSGAVGPGGVGR